jgi:hypothetical protein
VVVRKLSGHAPEAAVEGGGRLAPDIGDDRVVPCGFVVLHFGDAPSFSRREIPSEV